MSKQQDGAMGMAEKGSGREGHKTDSRRMGLSRDDRLLRVLHASPEAQMRIDRILLGVESGDGQRQRQAPLLMTSTEAANYLGVSRTTMWRIAKSGKIRKVRLGAKSYRYRRADVDACVDGLRADADDSTMSSSGRAPVDIGPDGSALPDAHP